MSQVVLFPYPSPNEQGIILYGETHVTLITDGGARRFQYSVWHELNDKTHYARVVGSEIDNSGHTTDIFNDRLLPGQMIYQLGMSGKDSTQRIIHKEAEV